MSSSIASLAARKNARAVLSRVQCFVKATGVRSVILSGRDLAMRRGTLIARCFVFSDAPELFRLSVGRRELSCVASELEDAGAWLALATLDALAGRALTLPALPLAIDTPDAYMWTVKAFELEQREGDPRSLLLLRGRMRGAERRDR